MKCFLPDFSGKKALKLMKKFGYITRQEDDSSLSFVRSVFVNEAQFPRFHASVFSCDGGLQVNIHLDQEDSQGHSNHQFVWSYHNPLVTEEVQRLYSSFDKLKNIK